MLPVELTQAASDAVESSTTSQSLGREDFLRMLIAQLENQDPLNPQDATEFTAQLAQFSSLEQLVTIGQEVGSLASSQELLAGAIQGLSSTGLLGREALVESSRFEVATGGALQSVPSFELDGSATSTLVRIRDESGRLVRELDLGQRTQGFHSLRDALEAASPLPPGIYDFEVAAQSGGVPVGWSGSFTGLITGAVPTGAEPLLQLGGIVVPYSGIAEIRATGGGS